MLQDFIGRVIDEGIRSIQEDVPEGLRRDGGIAGFELARQLPTLEDVEFALLQREPERRTLRDAIREEGTPEYEAYWLHRYATVQLEWFYELMKVAYVQRGGVLPPGTMLSARAMLTFARIVGVQEAH